MGLCSSVSMAADGASPLVFRVKPASQQVFAQPAVEQPAFEEMAEPEAAPAPTTFVAPPAKSAPLALTPRNLDYGSARGTPTAFQAPAPVSPRPVPNASTSVSLPPAAAPLGGKIVQLGAFRSPGEAEKALGNWRRDVPAAFARVAEPAIVAADLGEKGVFYRVRVPGFADSRRASEFCGEYRGPGRDCYVVP